MKIKVLWLLLCSLLCSSWGQASMQTEMAQDLGQALSKARHTIEAVDNGYRAFNPGNHQRYEFQPEGLVVEPVKPDGDWRLDLQLTGFGSTDHIQPVQDATVIADGQRIEYQRGNITEWYENKPLGLEQGFTIQQPPQDGGNSLILTMVINGGLKPVWQEQGQSLKLYASNGDYALTYNKLIVEDADQKRLPAHMELKDDTLQIHVAANNAVYPIVIDPLVVNEQKVIVQGADAASYDYFGESVSISGDTAVVGSPGDGVHETTGAAYVFIRSGGNWSQQAKLSASDVTAQDRFGSSVAIFGDTALIGASTSSVDLDTIHSGSAYVFIRSGSDWEQQAKLTASDAAMSHYFGHSVSLSGDSVAIGAWGNNAAYIFVRSGSSWSEQAKLTSSQMDDGSGHNQFGFSVSISGDIVLIGDDADYGSGHFMGGAAHVFTRSGTVWEQEAKLYAPDPVDGGDFGQAVSVFGHTALVGGPGDNNYTGAAYVFTRSGSSWSEQQKLTASDGVADSRFGASLSIAGDTALIGGPGDNNGTGAAYVFTRSGSRWSEQQKLISSAAAPWDYSGISVSLSGDTALVGAGADDEGGLIDSGSAYFYTFPPANQNSAVTPLLHYFFLAE